jgi:RNase P/RNase MRP subunit p29
MISKNIISTLFFTLFVACFTYVGKSAKKTNSTIYALTSLDDDTINERGLLKAVEDSGYPMATLTIEFPERNFTEHFIVNLEAVKGVNMNSLKKWVGKYVSFSYTSDFANSLMDLRINGKSIFNDNPIEITTETKKITGVLKGAKAETAGDLPDKISIVSKDNNLTFDFFITKEVVNVNGKRVTGLYEERVENTIKSIRLSR